MNLGPTELLLLAAILAAYVLPIWAIVDAATRPESAYAAIGASKTAQIVVLVVTALVCGIVGTIVSIFYLIGTRRELSAATTT
jgi:hypothetical protein